MVRLIGPAIAGFVLAAIGEGYCSNTILQTIVDDDKRGRVGRQGEKG